MISGQHRGGLCGWTGLVRLESGECGQDRAEARPVGFPVSRLVKRGHDLYWFAFAIFQSRKSRPEAGHRKWEEMVC